MLVCFYFIRKKILRLFKTNLKSFLVLAFQISSYPSTITHPNLGNKMYAYFLHFTDYLAWMSCLLLPRKYANKWLKLSWSNHDKAILLLHFPIPCQGSTQGEHVLGNRLDRITLETRLIQINPQGMAILLLN